MTDWGSWADWLAATATTATGGLAGFTAWRMWQIEQHRLHNDNRPVLRVEVQETLSAQHRDRLRVELHGPPSLTPRMKLWIILSIRDETAEWQEPHPTDNGDPDALEMRRNHPQGRWRFAQAEAGRHGRCASERAVSIGQYTYYALEHQWAPNGYGDPRDWGDRFADAPMRLMAEAELRTNRRWRKPKVEKWCMFYEVPTRTVNGDEPVAV